MAGLNVPWAAKTASPKGRSKAAHAAIAVKRPTVRSEVLHYIHSCGRPGCIDEEMEKAFDGKHKPNSVRTRRSELVKDGIVVNSGQVRLTTAGNEATVWVTVNYMRP